MTDGGGADSASVGRLTSASPRRVRLIYRAQEHGTCAHLVHWRIAVDATEFPIERALVELQTALRTGG